MTGYYNTTSKSLGKSLINELNNYLSELKLKKAALRSARIKYRINDNTDGEIKRLYKIILELEVRREYINKIYFVVNPLLYSDEDRLKVFDPYAERTASGINDNKYSNNIKDVECEENSTPKAHCGRVKINNRPKTEIDDSVNNGDIIKYISCEKNNSKLKVLKINPNGNKKVNDKYISEITKGINELREEILILNDEMNEVFIYINEIDSHEAYIDNYEKYVKYMYLHLKKLVDLNKLDIDMVNEIILEFDGLCKIRDLLDKDPAKNNEDIKGISRRINEIGIDSSLELWKQLLVYHRAYNVIKSIEELDSLSNAYIIDSDIQDYLGETYKEYSYIAQRLHGKIHYNIHTIEKIYSCIDKNPRSIVDNVQGIEYIKNLLNRVMKLLHDAEFIENINAFLGL